MRTAKRNHKAASGEVKLWKTSVHRDRQLLKKAQVRQHPDQAQRRSRLVEMRQDGKHKRKTKLMKQRIKRSRHLGTPVGRDPTSSEPSVEESSEGAATSTLE